VIELQKFGVLAGLRSLPPFLRTAFKRVRRQPCKNLGEEYPTHSKELMCTCDLDKKLVFK
jgi:hypothetical protein